MRTLAPNPLIDMDMALIYNIGPDNRGDPDAGPMTATNGDTQDESVADDGSSRTYST